MSFMKDKCYIDCCQKIYVKLSHNQLLTHGVGNIESWSNFCQIVWVKLNHVQLLSDGVGNNQLKYIRWCGWHETGQRCRSQESSPTTYLRCPYGAQRRFKRRYVLMLKLGWFDNIYETFLRLNICEEREEGIFWDFVTVSHISKESQKFHDTDSEEFQLYKHALEEEYKMQVFSDKMLQSSTFCFLFYHHGDEVQAPAPWEIVGKPKFKMGRRASHLPTQVSNTNTNSIQVSNRNTNPTQN